MRKLIMQCTMLAAAALLVVACGGNEPEPTPTAVATAAPTATEEAAPVEEESTTEEATEAEEASEEAPIDETTAEEAPAESESVAETEEITDTAAMTETEEVTETEEITETAEATAEPTEAATEEPTEEAGAEATPAPTEEPAEEAADTGAAAATGTVTVNSERAISEIVDEKWPYFATISPDGSYIAYGVELGRGRDATRNICIFTFENADKICFPAPEEYSSTPYTLVWSPDSSYIAFTENVLQLGDESDIWLFDIANATYINRTDDGATGSRYSAEPGMFTLDYLPMWNQSDGMLYFWRSEPTDALALTLALYRLDPAEGEPELVIDLADSFGTSFLLYDTEKFLLDGVSALAPDGSKVAFVTRSPIDTMDAPTNGLWVLDITTADAAPQQLMTLEEFQSALPPFQYLPAVPLGLSWTSDSSGIVAAAFSDDTHAPLIVLYHVDVASGAVSPIVDFSSVPDLATLYTPADAATIPLRYYSPWTVSMSPVGNKLLMYNDLGGVAGMLAATLPPDGTLPTPVYQGENISTGISIRSSRASDGKVIMYGELFTVEE